MTGRFRHALAADWEQFLIGERHLFYSFPCICKICQYYTYNNIDYNAAVLSDKNYVCIYTVLTYAFFAYFANCRQHNTPYYISPTLLCVLFVLRHSLPIQLLPLTDSKLRSYHISVILRIQYDAMPPHMSLSFAFHCETFSCSPAIFFELQTVLSITALPRYS